MAQGRTKFQGNKTLPLQYFSVIARNEFLCSRYKSLKFPFYTQPMQFYSNLAICTESGPTNFSVWLMHGTSFNFPTSMVWVQHHINWSPNFLLLMLYAGFRCPTDLTHQQLSLTADRGGDIRAYIVCYVNNPLMVMCSVIKEVDTTVNHLQIYV